MKSLRWIAQIFLTSLFCSFCQNAKAQFSVDTSTNYVQLLDNFASSGVSVSNVTYTGSPLACGYFSGGSATNLGIESGIVLSTGRVKDISNGVAFNGSFIWGTQGNLLLNSLSGTSTNDAAVLEFDVVPAFDTLSFSFIFASEDYPEFVGGNPHYLDYIGVFISGPNPAGGNYSNQNFALVPNTDLPVFVNTVNADSNALYFVENTGGPVMFDGFTTEIEVKIPVVPSSTYQMTFAIADGGDNISDSGLFLKSNSLKSTGMSTGIADMVTLPDFSFYPNPAMDNLLIKTNEKGILRISNQLGQSVYTVTINNEEIQLSTQQLLPGIYFLTFQTERKIVSKRLLVKH